jgi:hypothetical protein
MGRRIKEIVDAEEKIRIVASAGARADKEFWCLVFDELIRRSVTCG